MEPSISYGKMRELALVDPIAAYGKLLGIPETPVSLNASTSFKSFVIGGIPAQTGLDTTIGYRTWIDNISYSLSQPNVFANQVFKAQYDSCLRDHPGISVYCTVMSGPRYPLMGAFTPLETFANINLQRWVAGWPLYKQQNISVQFQLTDAPPNAEPNGPPYNVTLTFNGWQFLDPTLEDCSVAEADARLSEAGILPSDFKRVCLVRAGR